MKNLLVLIIFLCVGQVHAVEIYRSDAGSVNFYGQIRTELWHNKKLDNETTLDMGSSRMGITAKYNVNDDYYVNGRVEILLAKGGNSLANRLHYAGFGGSFGELSFGKQWVLREDLAAYGAGFGYNIKGAIAHYPPLTAALNSSSESSIHDNLIKYHVKVDNYLLATSYGLSENHTAAELYELYGLVNLSKTDILVGYTNESGYIDQSTNKDYKLNTNIYSASLSYHVNDDVVIQGLYNHSDYNITGINNFNFEENGFALSGAWRWSSKTRTYGGYEYATNNADRHFSNIDDYFRYFYIGSEYHFNQWSRIYIEYGHFDGSTLGFYDTGSDSFVIPNLSTVQSSFDSDHRYAIGYRIYW